MDGSVTEHETTPPRRYTKATLAADMSSVAKYVQDPQIKAVSYTHLDVYKRQGMDSGICARIAAVL